MQHIQLVVICDYIGSFLQLFFFHFIFLALQRTMGTNWQHHYRISSMHNDHTTMQFQVQTINPILTNNIHFKKKLFFLQPTNLQLQYIYIWMTPIYCKLIYLKHNLVLIVAIIYYWFYNVIWMINVDFIINEKKWIFYLWRHKQFFIIKCFNWLDHIFLWKRYFLSCN